LGIFIATAAAKTGIIGTLAEALKGLNTAIGGDETLDRHKQRLKLYEEMKMLEASLRAGISEGEIAGSVSREQVIARVKEIKEELKQLDVAGQKAFESATKLSTIGAAQKLDSGRKPKEEKKRREQIFGEEDLADREFQRKAQEAMRRSEEEWERQEEAEDKKLRAELERATEAEQKKQQHLEEEWRKAEEQRAKHIQEVADKEAKQWADAGAAIGGAFASSLISSLDTLASGGELDAAAITGDILAAVVATAVSLIPGGGAFAGMAGQLVKTGINAASGGNKRRRHNGGWAGDGMARYHLGTWVGTDEEAAILQTGERVLSRSEVSSMGGRRGVESAVRGGGGQINIQTFDAGSFREIFSGRARQGIIDANRIGRGVSSFFGGR
jgi:hypothetical protein